MPDKTTIEDVKKFPWNESVRLRPGMYIGFVNNRGFIGMIKSIFSNFLSQIKSNSVTLSLLEENKAELTFDNLQNPISDDCVVAHTNPIRWLTIELGALNALSEKFVVSFFDANNDCISKQEYSRGELQKGSRIGKELECKSIKFEFELDKEIWKDNFIWNENYITHEIRSFAYLYKRTKFTLKYKVEDEECKAIYYFKNGLKDRINVEILNGHGGSYFEIEIDKQIDDFHLETAFAFRNYSVDTSYLSSYVNDQISWEHGTHVDALLQGLMRGIMRYFEKHKLTETHEVSEEEIRENLIAILNIRMTNPNFSGSVRNNLKNREIVEPIVNHVANVFFEKIENDEESIKNLINSFKVQRIIKNTRKIK